MTLDFTKIACSIACNMPDGSASRKCQGNTTNSAEYKQLNVLEFIWRRYSDRPARDIKSTRCTSTALLNFYPDVFRYENKIKRFAMAQLAMFLSAEKNVNADCKNKIIRTESSEINLNIYDEAVICYRANKIETSSLSLSVEVGGDELTYPKLSRSQAYWLSIGEIIGAWLVKKKHKKKPNNKPRS